MGGEPRHARGERVGHLREAAVLFRTHNGAVRLSEVHRGGGSVVACSPVAEVGDAVLCAGVLGRGYVDHLLFFAGLENWEVSGTPHLIHPASLRHRRHPVRSRGAVGSVLHAAGVRHHALVRRSSSHSPAIGTHLYARQEL